MNRFSAAASVFVTLSFAAICSSMGCGGNGTAATCEAKCKCEKPTDTTCVKSCEDEGANAEALAAKAGCSGQYDDAISCGVDHSTCTSGAYKVDGASCANQVFAFLSCSSKYCAANPSACSDTPSSSSSTTSTGTGG